MTPARLFSASALFLALTAGPASLAHAAFECPAATIDAMSAATIKASLPTGDAFGQVEALNAAVTALRDGGVQPGLIVDGLIAAYCPTVADQTDLTDAAKTQAVRSFAARATRVVYALDSADAIILNVQVPPAVAEAIDAKAKAAGVSADDWMRGVLQSAVEQP